MMTNYVIIDGPGATAFGSAATQPITLRSMLTLEQRVKLEALAETSALARVIIADLDSPVTPALLAALAELGVLESMETTH